MPIIRQKWIKREDLQANPKVWYIFGDNEQRFGLGGQAGEMRDEPNAIGVATLSFDKPWSDRQAGRQFKIIRRDFEPAFAALKRGELVIYPMDGIGTGIANMPATCPKTFQLLQDLVALTFKHYGL